MVKKSSSQSQSTLGHRQRLRDRFLKSGLDGFHDYEIVELLLTLGTPRKDCKQAAKNVMKKFGSIRVILEAPVEELKQIEGIGSKNVFGLKLARSIALKYLGERVEGKDFIRSSEEVINYLRLNLRDRSREVFVIIYLNGRNQIMEMEELFSGTLTASAVYPREVVKGSLRNKAAALVFVHNHPSGNRQPSKEDIEITKKLKEAALTIDVVVHDHLIIAGDEYYSFADHGLL
ncbi:MAG: DNA repair protein RadC [Candidatus Marinimicrobia bacterium]|nr:DNA repair protein RadC [Candidatus Neomarinimicrobiota bacterium]MBL7047511.1 DNA repair protein RadC [Candidatus Neomarinimicrobiota bacterium]